MSGRLQAILLVGGRGTRLQPLTDTRPKPMLPILGRPFLEHQLEHLRSHGVHEVTFACGFLPRAIIEHFGDGDRLDMQLNYVVEPAPLGTGGAIGFAARTIEAERVLVCNGDVLTSLDIGNVVKRHIKSGATGTIALTPVEDPSRYGLVRTDDEDRVLEFLEKPDADQIDTNLINAGTYVLDYSVIDRIPDGEPSSIERDIFPTLVGHGLCAVASDAYWLDIGTVPSYLKATQDLLAGRLGGSRGESQIADNAVIAEGATIHGPVFLGARARVAAGAVVGPGAVIESDATVGEGARVVRSVVLEGADLQRESQVVDSIVGEDATLMPRCSVSDGAVVAPSAQIDQAVLRG